MKKYYLLICLLGFTLLAEAAKIKGRVIDEHGEPLPFASVYLKGTTKGTTTNLDGYYSYELPQGIYTLICQYVGYEKQEVEVNVNEETITKNFNMKPRGKVLKQVVIKKGEDPAYRIVRKAIKKRSEYNKQIDAYKANAYIKGSFKLNEVATSKMMMSLMGISAKDSAGKKELEDQKGIILLSESFNEIAYKRPNKLKVVVKSSRMSGDKSAYGFSEPMFVNMYDNNVEFGQQLSPRGFISPIAETALLNYKYELLNTYQEDGKTISTIKVIPRRVYEPLFAGTIDIIEEEWRLHSVNLMVDSRHNLEILDTLIVKQIFIPVNNVLMVKDQSFKMKFKLMGFGLSGNFVNVFSDYVFDYDTKKTFDKYEQVFEKEALTKSKEYWDQIRPVPLDTEEVADYIKKDSIELAEKSKKDTVKPSKNTLRSVISRGYHKNLKHNTRFSSSPLIGLNNFNWNTAEGLSYNGALHLSKEIDKDRKIAHTLRMRYGVSNQQFNAKWVTKYSFGKTNKSIIKLSGGRYVFQYNNDEPVNSFLNSFYTLFRGENYLKMYQAWFGQLHYQLKFINGFKLDADVQYQDRRALANTNLFTFRKSDQKYLTDNYPVEKIANAEPQHQALIAGVKLSYQPGRKYVKYPDRIVATSSHYPTFSAQFSKGLEILGSDVNYAKWGLGMEDDMNLNLWGTFMYKITAGGFLQNSSSFVADYTHFNGNQIILASPYLNSFQLSPYYANSNTENLFASWNAEHHFYGLLTNKIPMFRKLKWYLVASSNAYYVNRNNNYIELSAGLENIGYKLLRVIRVDGVVGYTNLKNPVYGIRIGINSGALSVSVGEKEED